MTPTEVVEVTLAEGGRPVALAPSSDGLRVRLVEGGRVEVRATWDDRARCRFEIDLAIVALLGLDDLEVGPEDEDRHAFSVTVHAPTLERTRP